MGYMGERTEEKVARKLAKKQKLVNVAAKRMKADLVLKNATYLNVFSSEFCVGDIAVSDGLIAGVGEYEGVREVDVSGKFVCPGLIDAHIHLESSMVSPAEFARAVVRHGTTTVICDPHEIANVMGVDGMTCQNCQRHVDNALNNLPDTLAEVNLSARNVTVWTKGDADEEVIRKAIRDAGYLPLRTKEKV